MLSSRNSLAFLLFGLCNSYAFVIMLSAAGDIVVKQKPKLNNRTDVCYEEITEAHCLSISTGAVLLANIIPCILVQITFLFFMQRVPFGIRHALVVLCQSLGLLIVAFSNTVSGSLTGVVFASLGAGIGAVNCLALSSHFPKSVVAMWSTGSGAAGITSSLSYAAFTEPHFAHLSTKTTLLIMLIIPFFYSIAYWIILEIPDTVHKIQILNPKTYIIKEIIYHSNDNQSNENKKADTIVEVAEKECLEMKTAKIVVEKTDKKALTFVSKLKLFVVCSFLSLKLQN
uniref:Battenin n=1 Tax=Panagrolaimus davidi TaxID=227884 RepID=A0A914QHX5_9BILA